MKRNLMVAILASMVAVSYAEIVVTTHPTGNPQNVQYEVLPDYCPEQFQLHPSVDILSLDYTKINPDSPKVEKIDIEIPVNGIFSYSAPVVNSEGDWWSSRFNDKALKCETTMKYDLEKLKTGAVGSDNAVKTEIFRANKKGKYKVEIVHVHKSKMVYLVKITVKVK